MPTNYNSLPQKLEAALVTYLDTVTTSMGLTGLQIVAAHQDTALEAPRAIITVSDCTAYGIDLLGVFNIQFKVEYISQSETTTAAHHTAAGTLQSWLFDISTVKAALNATADLFLHNLHVEGLNYEVDAEAGTTTSTTMFSCLATGAD